MKAFCVVFLAIGLPMIILALIPFVSMRIVKWMEDSND